MNFKKAITTSFSFVAILIVAILNLATPAALAYPDSNLVAIKDGYLPTNPFSESNSESNIEKAKELYKRGLKDKKYGQSKEADNKFREALKVLEDCPETTTDKTDLYSKIKKEL